MFIISDKRPQEQQTESNKEFLSSIITEFYKTIKDDQKPKYIQIRRLMFGGITNQDEKSLHQKDVVLAKQKLKFTSKLQNERQKKKQLRFMKNRKLENPKISVDNDSDESDNENDDEVDKARTRKFRPNLLKHKKSK